MQKIGKTLLVAMVMLCESFSFASTTLQSRVDRNEIGIGDTVTLTVSVVSTEDPTVQDPRLPDIDGFDLLNNSQSQAVAQKLVSTPQGMTFETQRRKEFNYVFRAKRAGRLSISAFEVVIDGKIQHTKPVVINVAEQSVGNPQAQGGGPGNDVYDNMDSAEEDLFNQILLQRQRRLQQQFGVQQQHDPYAGNQVQEMPAAAFRSLPTNPNEAFFISVEVDKTEVYEGEQVTANWYLYTRGQMETLDRLKFPDLRGFWKETISEVTSIQFMNENVNGTPWKKALLASHALFPIKAGTAVIDEYKIKSKVRLLSQGLGGFYGKAYEYTRSSSRVEIKVKPLPMEGRTQDFTGAVGRFDVHSKVENNTVPVNQPISLIIRFEGSGNAKVIDLPVMNLPPSLEQYDSKSESKFFKNGRSYKQFEVLLIPRQEGNLTIPAFAVGMFDPENSKYYTQTTQPIEIKVVNNPNAPVGSSSRMSDPQSAASAAKANPTLPDIIRAYEPARSASVLTQPWIWFVIYGGIFAALFFKMQRELGFGKRRRTLKDQVQKRFKIVDQAVSKSDYRKVGTEMTNIYYLVLGVVSGEGGAASEVARLLETIPPSLRRDHGNEIIKTFEIFQTLSFAPEEMLGAYRTSESLKSSVERGKKVISYLVAQ